MYKIVSNSDIPIGNLSVPEIVVIIKTGFQEYLSSQIKQKKLSASLINIVSMESFQKNYFNKMFYPTVFNLNLYVIYQTLSFQNYLDEIQLDKDGK